MHVTYTYHPIPTSKHNCKVRTYYLNLATNFYWNSYFLTYIKGHSHYVHLLEDYLTMMNGDVDKKITFLFPTLIGPIYPALSSNLHFNNYFGDKKFLELSSLQFIINNFMYRDVLQEKLSNLITLIDQQNDFAGKTVNQKDNMDFGNNIEEFCIGFWRNIGFNGKSVCRGIGIYRAKVVFISSIIYLFFF
jgi:hypothetical protein